MAILEAIVHHIYIQLKEKYPTNHIIKMRINPRIGLKSDNTDKECNAVMIRINGKANYICIHITDPHIKIVHTKKLNKYFTMRVYDASFDFMHKNCINEIDQFINDKLKTHTKDPDKFSRKKVFGQDISHLTLQRKNAKHLKKEN